MAKIVYDQADTLVRVKETQLLRSNQISGLVNAATLEDSLRLLRETVYGAYLREDKYLSFAQAITIAKKDLLGWAKESLPAPELLQFFAAEENFHTAKAMVKEEILAKDLSLYYLESADLTLADLKSAVHTGKSDTVPAGLLAAAKNALADYEEHQSLRRVDLILDNGYFVYLLDLAKAIDDPDIFKITTQMLDNYHLCVFAQMKGRPNGDADIAFSAGGQIAKEIWQGLLAKKKEEQNAFLQKSVVGEIWAGGFGGADQALLEVRGDNWLIAGCTRAKLMPFGAFPIFAFLFVRGMEMKNVRILLTGKKYGFAPAEIQKRMRAPYEL